jgi:branched-chain amino acid transport system ATP-binding protein
LAADAGAPHDAAPARDVDQSSLTAGDPASALLSVQGLQAGYGRITALHSLDLTVAPGEVVAMLGANGAGKSTTLRAITGMVRPTAGTVHFDGRDVTRMSGDAVARRGLAHVPEGRRVLPRLTVEENLRLGAFGRPARDIDKDVDGVFDRFERLRGRGHQKAGTLSGGEQQMLVIGRALMSRPKLMMLDEPSLGLSPVLVQEVFRMIRELTADGLTVLLVEQNVVQALGVADRGYVLTTGRVTGHGTSHELMQDPALLTSYLGGGTGDRPPS